MMVRLALGPGIQAGPRQMGTLGESMSGRRPVGQSPEVGMDRTWWQNSSSPWHSEEDLNSSLWPPFLCPHPRGGLLAAHALSSLPIP